LRFPAQRNLSPSCARRGAYRKTMGRGVWLPILDDGVVVRVDPPA
jgi:hypothetical protein